MFMVAFSCGEILPDYGPDSGERYRSSFVVRRSSFVVRRSSFAVRGSPFVARRSSF
jgi:hypothetical protein